MNDSSLDTAQYYIECKCGYKKYYNNVISGQKLYCPKCNNYIDALLGKLCYWEDAQRKETNFFYIYVMESITAKNQAYLYILQILFLAFLLILALTLGQFLEASTMRVIVGYFYFGCVVVVLLFGLFALFVSINDEIQTPKKQHGFHKWQYNTILFLRSHEDDQIPLIWDITAEGMEKFYLEEMLQKELSCFGTIKKIFSPSLDNNRDNADEFGIIKLKATQENWQQVISEEIDSCSLCIIIPGVTEGINWEVSTILSKKLHLARTIFIFPPLSLTMLNSDPCFTRL